MEWFSQNWIWLLFFGETTNMLNIKVVTWSLATWAAIMFVSSIPNHNFMHRKWLRS